MRWVTQIKKIIHFLSPPTRMTVWRDTPVLAQLRSPMGPLTCTGSQWIQNSVVRGLDSLLKAVEEQIKKLKGRMIIIDTSSGPPYSLTRQFYLKNEYLLAETIRDYYREGEDRMTYIKKLHVLQSPHIFPHKSPLLGGEGGKRE